MNKSFLFLSHVLSWDGFYLTTEIINMFNVPTLFTNDFNSVFREMERIHRVLKDNNGSILKLERIEDYDFNRVIEDYISGPKFEGLDGTYEDFWRVGPSSVNGTEDFMIEDSTGRYIPFEWYNIDNLIKSLQETKEKYYDLVVDSRTVHTKEAEEEKLRIQEKIDELQEQLKAA